MKDLLGIRMKEQYESRYKYKLMRRCPTIIRLDGKAFDKGLIEDMQQTALYLCNEIQGVKCAYVQSDEISLLLTDYDSINTQAWFDYNLQKMCSVSASLCTAKFNQLRLYRYMEELNKEIADSDGMIEPTWDVHTLEHIYGFEKLATFDSRAFQIADHEEVVNYFKWRYFDAVRNSKASFAQSMFSPKQLNGKNTDQQIIMCEELGYHWVELSNSIKYGTFIFKDGTGKFALQKIDFNKKESGFNNRELILNLIKYE